MVDLDELLLKRRSIRRELRAEYLQPHDSLWIVGFSGGKASTLLLHLVESPVFQTFVDKMLTQLRENIDALPLPVEIAPEVLRVNSNFDEGRIDPVTGYAIPDCDDSNPGRCPTGV